MDIITAFESTTEILDVINHRIVFTVKSYKMILNNRTFKYAPIDEIAELRHVTNINANVLNGNDVFLCQTGVKIIIDF